MGDLHLDTVPSGPLSYSEERFWQELGADRQTFIKRGTLLEVPLDEDVETRTLRGLVDTVTERHEILRTAYEPADGRAVRRVLPSFRHEVIECEKVPYPFDGDHPDRLTPRDRHALTPLIWEHVNPYGRYELDMRTRIAALA